MIKRAFHYALWMLGVVLVVSAMHYLWIAIFWYPGDLSLFWKSVAEQRPVHIKIKVIDQFGKPAADYQVAIKVVWISRYYWLFPLWASHESTCKLETDQWGNAKLSFPIRKALVLEFKEVNAERYIFPEGKHNPYVQTFNNNPRGLISVRNLDRTDQVIDMKVLRHDPPVKLTWYRPEIPGRGPIGRGSGGVEIEAQDEMVFTVDVMANKFLEGRQPGDIVITVKNAKTACEMFTKIYTPGLDFKEEGEWDVSCDALDGTVIQRAESSQIVTFAPETGYKKRLNFRMAIKREMSKAESDESNLSGGELFKLVRSAPDQDDYASIGPQGGLGAHLYLRHDNPRWYGIISIGLGPVYRKGKLGINADGAYNPTGSNNLWYFFAGQGGLPL